MFSNLFFYNSDVFIFSVTSFLEKEKLFDISSPPHFALQTNLNKTSNIREGGGHDVVRTGSDYNSPLSPTKKI